MNFNLKKARIDFNWSQMKLARESGVSLPTIQNIEAGKANPTVELLEKLLSAFGLKVQIIGPPFDADQAAELGVPLLAKKMKRRSDNLIGALKSESRKWFRQLSENTLNEREKIAIVAFLTGLKDHYSDFYRKEIAVPLFERIIEEFSSDGRVIKLRRIALANMSQYL